MCQAVVKGRTAVWGVLALVVAGCASYTPTKAPKITEVPLPEIELVYRLQVSDQIQVNFWGNEELNQTVRVRPDGKVSMPFIDDVHAEGLTPEELDAELVRRYSAELAQPEITVTVLAAMDRVYVAGEVGGGGGSVQIIGNMTLFQAIQTAGGFRTSARRRQVLLIRGDREGTPIARAIDMRPIESGEDPSLDIRIQPSDVIFVPGNKITSVNLFVQQYISQILPFQQFGEAAAAEVTRNLLFPSDEPTPPPTDGGGTPAGGEPPP